MAEYKVIGLMSGTSLDGVDLAYCHFNENNKKWEYRIEKASTIPYDLNWKNKLSTAYKLSGNELKQLHSEYGSYLGDLIHHFIEKNKLNVDFIASHGHTIFHQPENNYTLQIGKGSLIAAKTNLTVINDFRSSDVKLGGQGAPLVPIGDSLLFGDYDYCLNMGGFANISFEENQNRIAFDICPVNIVLNHYCRQNNLEFDDKGNNAKKGEVNEGLLRDLNSLNYYQEKSPKSLGREWVDEEIFPLIDRYQLSFFDLLKTYTEHIAMQIGGELKAKSYEKVLITGGGAYNDYLIKKIKFHTKCSLHIPDHDLINYKEALIFAFLGILRFRNEINILSSVTGVPYDHCSGQIHNP